MRQKPDPFAQLLWSEYLCLKINSVEILMPLVMVLGEWAFGG